MRKPFFFFLAVIFTLNLQAQTVKRPKLVVGLVVDQMRWDYLYRYADRFAPNGGFKRLLGQGFSCENTLIPYTPTVTACGHSAIYTGTVPAISGITGNNWYDNEQRKEVYCTDDKSVTTVGSMSALGQMSPRNMLVTSICDELRMATNFKSKVVGVAIKDRGGILPAGHTANAAYWYDNTNGNFITSTFYMNTLPQWAQDFNNKKMVDQYYNQGWNTLYPVNTYLQSTEDEKPYESKPFGAAAKTLPYDLKSFAGKNYGIIATTPMGNSLTAEFAKAAITGEQLGADNITDFLAVSFSSTDYIGHSFGPNSVEQEDDFLRLDKELGLMLDFLDAKVGKNQYLVFLSADHGVAHIPGFLEEHHIPTGILDINTFRTDLNDKLKSKFGIDKLVSSTDNYQIYLSKIKMDSAKLSKDEVMKYTIEVLESNPLIARVIPTSTFITATLNKTLREMLINGYYPRRSGDIQVILMPQVLEGFSKTGTTHGLWNPYDSHIPLLWYGWGIKPGKTNRETYMTDIAPTLAALLHIQAPSGTVGKVIEEVVH